MNRVAGASLIPLLLFGGACTQDGSDIGPSIEPELPNADYRVLVRDDQGRGVSAAVVSITGNTQTYASGRSGRALVLTIPNGIRLITVDGTNASATDTDMLGTLTVAAATPDGNELPYVFNLPDVSQSVGLTLMTGAQALPNTLDDSATSGAILTVPAGTTVTFGAAMSVTLRSGSLLAGHLPGDLPVPPSGGLLVGQGAYVNPNAVTFAPGADLSLPNDLLLPGAASADLLFLDPTSGNWVTVGTGTVVGARIVATGLVTQGGLYAFATTVPTTASVTGRVINSSGLAVTGVLVRAGEGKTRTASNGTFSISGLAAELGDGSPRTVNVEFTGGRSLWPSSTNMNAALVAGGSTDLGDITLETFQVRNVRMMLITRGRQDMERRMAVSSSLGSTSTLWIGDGRGQATFEDQQLGDFGWLTSRARDSSVVLNSQGVLPMEAELLTYNLQAFSREIGWLAGSSGGTALFALDSRGTGGIPNVRATLGFPPSAFFIGVTGSTGFINTEIVEGGQATLSLQTSSDGRTFVTAFSMVDPLSSRAEIPIERADSLPLGAFDRNGLLTGDLVGGAAPVRMMRSTRLLDRNDWYDSVFLGRDSEGDVPIKLDPAVTGGTAFTVGVAHPKGNVSAVEGTSAGGDFTLDRFGVEKDLIVPQGTRLQMDLALPHMANTAFLAPNALNNLDPSIAPTDLEFDLALEQDDAVVDIVQGVGGNMAFSGLDATFTLPSLSGLPTGSEYLVAFGGSNTSGGTTVDQRTVITLDGTPGPVVQFMDVPAILSPAPGAMVPATGFTVDYTVPVSTLYIVVDLRSEMPTETRVWTAILPASFTSFEFFTLPSQSVTPLTPGLTWTLTVTAARVEEGPVGPMFTTSYRRMVSHFVGISAAERVVNAFSSSRITITTF